MYILRIFTAALVFFFFFTMWFRSLLTLTFYKGLVSFIIHLFQFFIYIVPFTPLRRVEQETINSEHLSLTTLLTFFLCSFFLFVLKLHSLALTAFPIFSLYKLSNMSKEIMSLDTLSSFLSSFLLVILSPFPLSPSVPCASVPKKRK